jgi:hypothetical protein
MRNRVLALGAWPTVRSVSETAANQVTSIVGETAGSLRPGRAIGIEPEPSGFSAQQFGADRCIPGQAVRELEPPHQQS